MSDSTPHVHGATYRLQFNQNFTFADATQLIPYLHTLGVTDLYASPYLRARPGSLHGYDVFDHGTLNPEIGSESEHTAMSRALAQHGMGQVVDIVPNHMGIAAGENRWWTDVLENGPSSPYAPFFDIDWEPLQPELAGKVLLPILGDPFGRVVERGELQLAYDDGHFRIDYFEHRLPASPISGALVLRAALEDLGLPDEHPDHMELESIVVALERLPARSRTDSASVAERRREKAVTERRVRALHEGSDSFRGALQRAVDLFNGTPGDPQSFDRLDALLDNQAYRLAFWRVAAEEINYRRFFDINDLAGLRMERGEVFDATHELVLRWVAEGKVTGLRIDHPDGLFDPRGYLRHLDHESARRSPDGPRPIWVEKILTGDEPLPNEWPVAGTVGYEFLNRAGGLFVATRNRDALDAIYRSFAGHIPPYRDLVIDRKRLILRTAMVSELNVLAYLLDRLANQSRHSRDFTLGSLTHALRETIAAFPVYRTYIDAVAGRVSETDRGHVREALRVAKRLNRTAPAAAFDFVGSILLLEWPEELDDHNRSEHARFVMKFQQLTGPAMAKGAEDTAFYTYNRLISLNEVGGEPDRFGVSPEEFHHWISDRAANWPRAMNTSSTHDTKRSEDVRARINALSEMPDAFAIRVRRWAEMNAQHKAEEDGNAIPDANDEYLLYQTLLGAWPLGVLDEAAHAEFVARIRQYMEKATREAKIHTSWISPNEAYDEGTAAFVDAILRPDGEFVEDFVQLQRIIARLGMINSLAQTLLKLACPGVPDIYQGQEVWDFSLVDPDNRRPVDYALRQSMLDGLVERDGPAHELLANWEDGRIKMYVTHRTLQLRRKHPDLFAGGDYVPLQASGRRADHAVAFARRAGAQCVIAIVPRLVATLTEASGYAFPTPTGWADTQVSGAIPPGRYREVFSGTELDVSDSIPVAELLGQFPVALLDSTS